MLGTGNSGQGRVIHGHLPFRKTMNIVSPNGFRLMLVLCPSNLFFLWCLRVASGISYSSATALQLMPGSVTSSLSRAASMFVVYFYY